MRYAAGFLTPRAAALAYEYMTRPGNSIEPADRRIRNVLFLSTCNSARSIMAEALINKLGSGRYRGFSAGSHPTGKVHPLALHALNLLGCRTDCLSSKGWDEFSRHDAPRMDLIVTVCSDVAGLKSPDWPGQPTQDFWELEDPGAVRRDRQFEAFMNCMRSLQRLIGSLTGPSIEFTERSNISGWNPGNRGADGHSRH